VYIYLILTLFLQGAAPPVIPPQGALPPGSPPAYGMKSCVTAYGTGCNPQKIEMFYYGLVECSDKQNKDKTNQWQQHQH
jgi:hypothetical protein